MTLINDQDRSIFSNAEKTAADNFTADELREVHEIAVRLNMILKASIHRQQESLKTME
jgi:hypothetical protein